MEAVETADAVLETGEVEAMKKTVALETGEVEAKNDCCTQELVALAAN
jgi:hypothetical protein